MPFFFRFWLWESGQGRAPEDYFSLAGATVFFVQAHDPKSEKSPPKKKKTNWETETIGKLFFPTCQVVGSLWILIRYVLFLFPPSFLPSPLPTVAGSLEPLIQSGPGF